MTQLAAEEVLQFWTVDVGPPSGWFATNVEIDRTIRERFAPRFEPAAEGAYDAWLDAARSALALIVLLDQFPRNAYRGAARAFAYDPEALARANIALRRGWDLEIEPPLRAFFYLPLEHSEDLSDQKRACALVEGRLASNRDYVFHAHRHRDVIARFGRFPHRNAALGRGSTPQEEAFLAGGGYNPSRRAQRNSDPAE